MERLPSLGIFPRSVARANEYTRGISEPTTTMDAMYYVYSTTIVMVDCRMFGEVCQEERRGRRRMTQVEREIVRENQRKRNVSIRCAFVPKKQGRSSAEMLATGEARSELASATCSTL